MHTEPRRPARLTRLSSALAAAAAGLLCAAGAALAISSVEVLRDSGEEPERAVVLEAGSPVVAFVDADRPLPAVGARGRSSPEDPRRELSVVEGVLRRGDTLASALRRKGVGREVAQLVATELAPHFDFRRAQPGHRYRLASDAAGRLVDFRYRTSSTQSYRLFRDGDRYRVNRERTRLVSRLARIAGIVTSSLYRSIRDLGESSQLAADLGEIFAWDIDFSRAAQPGDEFRILYERLFHVDPDGVEQYVRTGRILAADYVSRSRALTAVYFETEPGKGGYYRPDGTSVMRSFLRAPLRYTRISSRYSAARRHPILKVTRPHHGIDYAAPAGTPIWAVADGEVTYLGRAGGFGNLVKVRHENGYVSYYGHLSHFRQGLRVGQRVQQKQLIGYVGQTGLATGPHVCFRVSQNGRYLDPTRLASPAGQPVPSSLRYAFYSTRDTLLAALGGRPAFAAREAL